MAMFKVLYAKKIDLPRRAPVVFDSWFDTIGDVEANSTEGVFEYMNTEGPSKFNVRSMMVGDVVIADDGAWRCEPAGWCLVDILSTAELIPRFVGKTA
jgi:hypothetical protein